LPPSTHSPLNTRTIPRFSNGRRELALLGFLIALLVAMGVVRPEYLRPDNLRDILSNAAIPAVAAAGMTILIVAAQIDISVGAGLSVAAVTVVLLGRSGCHPAALFAAAVATGGALGVVNGLLTAYLRIPSIVATLATLGAIRGLLVLTTRGDSFPAPEGLVVLGNSSWLGIPPYVWLAATFCAGTGVYLAHTRGGRSHYAVGSSPRSAQLSGIVVPRVVFKSFVILGALVGAAGFLHACRFTPIYPTPPRGFELEVITAVVVGGTDIMGGRGTVIGTVIAAVLLSAISVALTFLGSSFSMLRSEVQPAVQGVLILAAVLCNSSRREDGGAR
jgi:ribose/xylose/arabinose/galactoside ABC-type transport system permease subunit